MNTTSLVRHFDEMGARIAVRHPAANAGNRWRPPVTDYSLDIESDRRGQLFVLSVPEAIKDAAEFTIMQVDANRRHLLLMGRKESDEPIDRFLCGHDEREWFVAAVPGAVSTIDNAMESLKPPQVLHAQARKGLDSRKRNRRKNEAFRRQGEWFFIPRKIDVDPGVILTNEPIARSGGKPHLVEQLYRTSGERIYVSDQYPNGISVQRYRGLLSRKPSAKGWNWHQRVRNASVYARGTVRHRDHQTITLHDWHEVLMNTEHQSRTMQHVAFID